MKKLLLIDGDIPAMEAASISETETWWDDGIVTIDSDFEAAKRIAKSNIERIRKELKAEKVVFVRSCSTRHYFRHDLLPDYKGNRTTRPPLVLKELKLWLMEEYESLEVKGLEADDVVGIYATDPDYYPEYRKIIVSVDKDMQTIPAYQFDPRNDYQEWCPTLKEANRFHIKQALMGDKVDNYSGCIGMGEATVEAWLKEPYQWEKYEHVFKSGKRKGESEVRWRKVEPTSLMDAYISLFLKAGQTKEDAFVMWKIARILRHGDVDENLQPTIEPYIGKRNDSKKENK